MSGETNPVVSTFKPVKDLEKMLTDSRTNHRGICTHYLHQVMLRLAHDRIVSPNPGEDPVQLSSSGERSEPDKDMFFHPVTFSAHIHGSC
jgi:hypothetical protein